MALDSPEHQDKSNTDSLHSPGESVALDVWGQPFLPRGELRWLFFIYLPWTIHGKRSLTFTSLNIISVLPQGG